MKKIIFLFISITIIIDINGQCKLDKSNYNLVFDETFDNYSGLISNLFGTSSVWKAFLDGDIYAGKDQEYYLQSQVSLIPDGNSGHILRLTATRLPNIEILPNGSEI